MSVYPPTYYFLTKHAAADGLREAVRYMLIAESDYATLQCLQPLMNVQYLLSVIYHNLDLEKQRDEAAKRHMATNDAKKKIEIIATDDQVKNIWEVVLQVGAALAAR
jgi:anaphase-promoting complex subunit 5